MAALNSKLVISDAGPESPPGLAGFFLWRAQHWRLAMKELVPRGLDLDTPIWDVKLIGEEAGLFKPDGNVDVRRVYYQLERGYLDGTKRGGRWVFDTSPHPPLARHRGCGAERGRMSDGARKSPGGRRGSQRR
jgi:hypothetical protein